MITYNTLIVKLKFGNEKYACNTRAMVCTYDYPRCDHNGVVLKIYVLGVLL